MKLLRVLWIGFILAGCGLGNEIPYNQIASPGWGQGGGGLQASETAPALLARESSPPTMEPTRLADRPPTQTPEPTRTITRQATNEPLPSTVTPEIAAIQKLCSPLEYVDLLDTPRVVSDGYHPPPMGSDARHQGVDLAYYHWKNGGALEGTRIQAVLGGVVAAAVADTFPFGNLVIVETPVEMLPLDQRAAFEIDEGKSLYLLYAHLGPNSPAVQLGERVESCATLGYAGKTGNTEATHLHLETRVGPSGARFSEFSAFRESDSNEAKANYRLWRTSGTFLHFDPLRLLLFELTGGATATVDPFSRDRP